ncbi:hypothetical protein SASPL_149030 [Salvia splendens]|uniref:TFIIS central domain-containing protein n=1 Tax=Salvia splendens TaxID=180675 RepID=A0A8X8Z4W6_SALSN|nr:uncharacterized protein LOC121779631 [Salvia splendens]KAG6391277.1 hypothetical protein SASPL_149030 [Salvia splendens]
MSNNLVSQYPISDRQLAQMEHGSSSLEFPAPEMPMKMAGQVSSNPEPQHFSVPVDRSGLLESLSGDSGFNTSLLPNNMRGHNEYSGVGMGSNQVWMSNQLGPEHAISPNSIAAQKASFPLKRKAEMEPSSNSDTSLQLTEPYNRPAHVGSDANSPGYLQHSAHQKRTAQSQSRLGSPVTPVQPIKKMMRNDSMSGKSGLQRGQTGKRQTAQTGSASKVRSDSSEGIRSKLRESLSAALALACQNQENALITQKNQQDTHNATDPRDSHVSSSSEGGQVPVSGSADFFRSNELASFNKTGGSQVFTAELPHGESRGNEAQAFQGFQYSLPDEDVPFGDNFFVKDDLLQGNGLSWAFDFDMHMGEGKESQHTEKSLKEEAIMPKQEVETLTPEDLAFKIEAELFKLFGDANKKYREKGRSLLFNLKDRNNPELRERVMSGKISPERLCSMSAEELASKELTEWRMAKAEELAQMKVLPDTEVDIRRLVRKTHKGEFQVEVEHDDPIVAEVSAGTSLLTRPLKKKTVESQSPSGASVEDKEKVAGQGSSLEGPDLPGSLIIQTDGTDPMQGMMVDELKDTDLPPIVSLDEFMESLNNEPPFENLSADGGKKSPVSYGESPKRPSNLRASNRVSEIRKDATPKKAPFVKKPNTKDLSGSPAKETARPSDVPKKADLVWNGILQLNISSSITVGGLFYSGEKTSTKEWSGSLEIKGRVRVDAFEKFLQELPMSRTRAVMVLHFILRDKSSEEQRSNLTEAISSYIGDERLGYAEPVAGVELYLCPPASRMFEMLNKHILRERPGTEESFENGLIGVVVWRRAHISNAISPNSSSHQKHAFKKQPLAAPPKRFHDSPNLNPNTPTRKSQLPPPDDDNDDIPPGFGPGAAEKDDDDLPEFNFSARELNPSASRNSLHGFKKLTRPVEDVRELIKKYGQGGPSVVNSKSVVVDDRRFGIEPWNDDDDDDIPEWRPQAPQLPHHQAYAVPHGHQLPLHLHPSDGRTPPPAVTQLQRPPGGAWAAPPGYQHGPRWRQY